MPLPTPHSGESRSDFVSRCMGSDVTRRDFPNQSQRAAVCQSQWRRSHSRRNENEMDTPITVTTNRASYPVRRETLHGRPHLVVPVVMLVEGVHNGIFYSADEISSFYGAWNGRPVPVYHPETQDGSPLSANDDPRLHETQVIGTLWNTHFQDNSLRSEVWVDIDKAKEINAELLCDLESGARIEVSTGLWGEIDDTHGEWNGHSYSSSIHNIRPDHLALLPGRVGACSWEDGCGIRINNDSKLGITLDIDQNRFDGLPPEVLESVRRAAHNILKPHEKQKPSTGGDMPDTDTPTQNTDKESEVKPTFLSWIRAKLTPFANISEAVEALQEGSIFELFEKARAFVDSKDVPEQGIFYFLRGLYDDRMIYERRANGEAQLFEQEFSVEDSGDLTPDGDPTRVREKREYVPAEQQEETVTTEEKVQKLIAMEKSLFSCTDKDYLEGLEEARLDQFIALAEAGVKTAPAVLQQNETQETEETEDDPAPVDVDTYVANAPDEVQAVLRHGMRVREQHRSSLISRILTLEACPWTEAELQAQEDEQLEKLATLARPVHDYSGGAGNSGSQPVQNTVEPLPTPGAEALSAQS